MDSRPAVYLAPCSNDDAQEHLQRTVIDGVEAERYGQHTTVRFGDPVSIWGVKEGNRSHWEALSSGDYLFFYTGDKEYSQVAEVLGIEQNEDLAEDLWPGFDETWKYIIYLSSPIPVEIDSSEVADFAGYDQDYILGFQSLRERGVEEMVDEYGSVENYIHENRTDKAPKPPQGSSEPQDDPHPLPTADVSNEDYQTIARQLSNTGQVVFYGPPGTGKTFHANQFARWWLHKGRSSPTTEQVRSVTFHPSFTYEDFIEGLSANAGQNGVSYDIEPGVFKEICEDAQQAYDETNPDEIPPRYVLIIDEINRGNLAQIFGETITLLEKDKRGEMSVSLAHSGESFTIPPNLYIIGTMNTADRSIALVDAALRRRFRFIDFPPEYEVLHDRFGFNNEAAVLDAARGNRTRLEELQALSILAIETLNDRIIELPDLGKGKQIGHSYLLVDSASEEPIIDAWRYEILPLLEEYFYGQMSRIRDDMFDGNGDELVDWEREQIRDFDAITLRETLRAITQVS